MSRKRNANRKSMAFLHSVAPYPSIEEYESEYYRPGCYCVPQAMPHVIPYTCAYLHEYVPQWTAPCNTATYVVDTYGIVYYLSDFEHQMQFLNNTVDTDIVYHIPTYFAEHDCEVVTEEDESESISPRKRERIENENDVEESEEELLGDSQKDSYKDASDKKCMVDPQVEADIVEHGYYVEEPADIETVVIKKELV